MSEPYVNHVALSLDGARFGATMSEMRWEPKPSTQSAPQACRIAALAPAESQAGSYATGIPLGPQIGTETEEDT